MESYDVLIVGAGPIVIGQGCEFDYSGTQACNALREEGYKVILINSNPATIITDPDTTGKPFPSGLISISQDATSLSVAGLPKPRD